MVSLELGQYSLDKVLRPDPEIEAFLADDEFWTTLPDDRAIPLKWALEKDATFPIVGKELEILTGKLAIYKAAQLEFYRRLRFSDLSLLLLTVEHLKKKGFHEHIHKREQELRGRGDYDWEHAYKTILAELEDKNALTLDDVIASIFTNQEDVTLATRIDETLITAKLREELPTPITYFLLGPMGSGKSFIQRRLEAWRGQLYKSLGLTGYDRLALRDKDNRAKAYLRTFLGGEGLKIMTYFDAQEEKRKHRNTWKRRALWSAAFFFPVYFALRMGWEWAKYQWGLLGDIDPIADIAFWVDRNYKWIVLGAGLGATYKFYSLLQRKLQKAESERPEWVANSSSTASVLIGTVERKDILGDYTDNFEVAPQQRFSKARLLECDGKSLIIEQLSDLDHDNQSIIAQVIQEKELSVGDKGEYTTNIFPFISIGLNPHLKHDVIPPLWDRMKLGYGCMVSNEIVGRKDSHDLYEAFIEYSKDLEGATFGIETKETIQRSKRLERKFFAFLKYHRRDNKPFSRDAWQVALAVSSMLAERKDQLLISREFVSILNKAIDLANLKEHQGFVTGGDIFHAALTTRSEDQSSLQIQLKKHYSTLHPSEGIGTAYVLGFLIDEKASRADAYTRQIAEENGLGYLLPITAVVSPGTGSVQVLTSTELSPLRSHYEERLTALLHKAWPDFSQHRLMVDLTKALCDDDALLVGMYVAASSAKEKYALKPERAILCATDLHGRFEPILKPNKRLLTCYDILSEVILSRQDLAERVDATYFPQISLTGVGSLEDLLEVVRA